MSELQPKPQATGRPFPHPFPSVRRTSGVPRGGCSSRTAAFWSDGSGPWAAHRRLSLRFVGSLQIGQPPKPKMVPPYQAAGRLRSLVCVGLCWEAALCGQTKAQCGRVGNVMCACRGVRILGVFLDFTQRQRGDSLCLRGFEERKVKQAQSCFFYIFSRRSRICPTFLR